MDEQYIIVGGGGHALSLADAVFALGLEPLGFTAPTRHTPLAGRISWLGDDTALARHAAGDIALLNGLGSIAQTAARQALYARLTQAGFTFAGIVHPAASVSGLVAALGNGHQVLAGAVLNAGVSLGNNVLVNSGAVVEHGCRLGEHVHVASGATLCGDCRVGAGAHIGAGATVLQGIEIGAGAIIAAGAVVTKSVEPLTLVGGVPGRVIRTAKAR